MTYDEFTEGLYAKYHYVPNSSILFIPAKKETGGGNITFQDIVALIVDAENVLKYISNKNMIEAFLLMAQGYLEWEVAEIINISDRTIRRYIGTIKRNFKNNVLF